MMKSRVLVHASSATGPPPTMRETISILLARYRINMRYYGWAGHSTVHVRVHTLQCTYVQTEATPSCCPALSAAHQAQALGRPVKSTLRWEWGRTGGRNCRPHLLKPLAPDFESNIAWLSDATLNRSRRPRHPTCAISSSLVSRAKCLYAGPPWYLRRTGLGCSVAAAHIRPLGRQTMRLIRSVASNALQWSDCDSGFLIFHCFLSLALPLFALFPVSST